jgi:glycosyltransferase involved in cell wall biosynthesis
VEGATSGPRAPTVRVVHGGVAIPGVFDEEQRSARGCIVGRIQLAFHHGLLAGWKNARDIVADVRVARIITRLNIGGPAIQAVNLSSRLTACGIETLLVHGTIGEAEGDMSYLLDQATPRPRTLHVRGLRSRPAPAREPIAWWQIYRALCAFRPDIVHTHMAKAGALGRTAAVAYNRTAGRRRPARIVHTYHGHVLEGYFGAAATAAFLGIERQLASATDRLVVIAPRLRDDLAGRFRIGQASQYRVVPLGFDLERFGAIDDAARARARGTLDLPPSARVVTTVGRLTAIKNHDLFLAAAEAIAQHQPEAVFLIAGDGELRGALEARTRAAGLAERVRFLGWRRDLEVLYGATDVFLLTSRNEGTPVALIESLAAGCAAVATDVGGVSDVIPTSEFGLLAPSGDAGALARHVSGLLSDPLRRRAMGESGRTAALARYGLNRLIADVAALYRELCS